MISQRMQKKLQRGSPIRTAYHEAQRLRAMPNRKCVFDLSLGNPAAPPPFQVRQAILALANNPVLNHGYMCEAGYESVRKRVAQSLNDRFQAHCGPEHVVMTTGAAGGLNAVLFALLDPGDEVVVFRPYYPAYAGFIETWGGSLVGVFPQGLNFYPDLHDLDRKITPRTKAVLVNSPNNPTGTIYPSHVAQGIAAILEQKQKEYGHAIYLISDEPYRELIYDGSSMIWWPHVYRNTVVIYSFSKSLSLPGERIGYVLASPFMQDGEQFVQAVRLALGALGYVNAPAFFQRVVGQCLDAQINLEYYDRNRRLLYDAVQKSGFEAVEPRGAFYIFVASPLKQERDFLELARHHGLIFVGGSAFGWEGYARLSFCGPYEELLGVERALKKLAFDCGLK